MNDRVLYFPHISVPDKPWFARALLYWDEVGSIVPSQYSSINPELTEYMNDLMSAEMVKAIHPNEHIGEIPHFTDAFLELLDEEIATGHHRSLLVDREVVRVHVDKMALPLADELRRRRLARPISAVWYDVEKTTAIQFMIYLAASLGNLPELNYIPITDEADYLALFAGDAHWMGSSLILRHRLRATVLEAVLPAPQQTVSAGSLATFKSKYADSLTRFRSKVESAVIQVAAISDEHMQNEQLALTSTELHREAEEIQARMRESGWPSIVFGTFCSLGSAAFSVGAAALTGQPLLAAGSAPGLISAVYNAFKGSQRQQQLFESPMAYAAFVSERLR